MLKKKVGAAVLAGCLAMGAMALTAPSAQADNYDYSTAGCNFDHTWDGWTSLVSRANCTGGAQVRAWVSYRSAVGTIYYDRGAYVMTGASVAVWPGSPTSAIDGWWDVK